MEMVKLHDLMKSMKYEDERIWEGISITGIQYDSRKVQLGNVFVAIKGFEQDGHKYIQNAIDNGAIAIIASDKEYCGYDYPWILVEDTRVALAEISSAFYSFPTEKLQVIGVTGTNGKTTVTNMIAHILESEGNKVGLIGTICNRIGDKILPCERTTPESLELQKLFRDMLDEGVKYVVMEVSSHALDLHRVDKCNFDVTVFTNLTQDHLDYHKDMESYCKAKTKLFMLMDRSVKKEVFKTSIVNLDDEYANKFLVSSGGAVATYGIEKAASYQAVDIMLKDDSMEYTLDEMQVKIAMSGRFNVYNSLAAIASVEPFGISEEKAIKALASFKGVKGRFQRVESDKDFSVIVDYAHTPDSLKNALQTAREITKNKLIAVFGCGGDRDKTKRAVMGQMAGLLADFSFVTSDNPRSEKMEDIIENILPGMRKVGGDYKVVVDRKEAIIEAINMATTGDVVLIAGKGHEDYQEINGVKHHFDDYEVAKDALK